MLKDALDTYLAVRHAAGFALVDDEHRSEALSASPVRKETPS
jgi:hypothetical protein